MATPKSSKLMADHGQRTRFTAAEIKATAQMLRREASALDNEWPEPDEYCPHRGGDAQRKVADMLDAFARSLEAGGGWRPIETAPKDGTEFLAWFESGLQDICYWCAPPRSAKAGFHRHGKAWTVGPTHWQPLPAPPAQDGGRP